MQCVHMTIHLQLGHKHEITDTTRYIYQTQTVKPVFRSDSIVSLTELIAAGHFVLLPHVAGVGCPPALQTLWEIQNGKIHGSLTER